MLRFLFALVLIAGIAAAAPVKGPNPDSLKLITLSAKVDSLSQVLRDSKLSSEYAKETLAAYKESDDSLKGMFQTFLFGTISILGIASVGLGVWVYQRTEGERQAIAIQVRELVTPEFDLRLSGTVKRINAVDTELKDFVGTYNKFSEPTVLALASLKQGQIDHKVILDKIEPIARRVEFLEIKSVSKVLKDKKSVIEHHLSTSGFAYATKEILTSLKLVKSINADGIFDFKYREFADFLIELLTRSTSITPVTKLSIIEAKNNLTEADWVNVELALNALAMVPSNPIPNGLVSMFDTRIL